MSEVTGTTVEHYKSDILTLANQLTMLRIVFVPVFVILLVYNRLGWALLTFLAAGVTDGALMRMLRPGPQGVLWGCGRAARYAACVSLTVRAREAIV